MSHYFAVCFALFLSASVNISDADRGTPRSVGGMDCRNGSIERSDCCSSMLDEPEDVDMQSRNCFQLTLAILKPHVVKSPFALQKIRDLIIDNNFKVVRSRRATISREEAELFYKEHRDKFFYNRLLTFMCSGPSDIHILARHDAVAKWRQLMGPTKVYQAQYNAQDTIRGMFGLSDTRNATHGSDSAKSAEREIMIFFKDFYIKKWHDNEEMFYNLGRLHFDPTSFVHTIDKTYIQNERVTK